MGKLMTHPYAFIHPLVSADELTSGYLIEHSPSGTEASADPTTPLAQSIVEHPLFSDFDQRHPWFLPAAHLGKVKSSQIVPIICGSDGNKADLLATGHSPRPRLARQTEPSEKLPSHDTCDYLLISIGHARALPPLALPGMAGRTQLISTGVHSRADHHWATGQGCTLSTCEYLLARQNSGKKADTTRQKMLRLLSLISQDADTRELEAIFRQETKLAYSLLRLVNAAAMAPRTPVTSFTQAINLLGRRQLERWVQLLIYADPDNGHLPNPLLYKAAVRGRLMELLIPQLDSPRAQEITGDAAFMIGCFSLLDALLNLSMSEVVMQLPLPQQINEILLHYSGQAGQLLLAIKAADMRNLTEAEKHLHQLAIDPTAFMDAQIRALHWANGIQQT